MKDRETSEQREKRFAEHAAVVAAEQQRQAVAEMNAMETAFRALHPLPPDGQKRALRWLADRLDNFAPPAHSFYSDECPF